MTKGGIISLKIYLYIIELIFINNTDSFVKSSFSALRRILRHCGVAISTPLSPGFARLETKAFYFAVQISISNPLFSQAEFAAGSEAA